MKDTLTQDRSTWQSLFDSISEGRSGDSVSIEVLDQDFGDQTEAQRMPFSSITYDARGDVVIIAVGGSSSRWPVVLRHLVHHPVQVDLLERAPSGLVLRIVDRDDAATLVDFAGSSA